MQASSSKSGRYGTKTPETCLAKTSSQALVWNSTGTHGRMRISRALEILVALLVVVSMQTVYVKRVDRPYLEILAVLTIVALVAVVLHRPNSITSADALFIVIQACLVMIVIWVNLVRDPDSLTRDAVVIAASLMTFCALGVVWFSTGRNIVQFLQDISAVMVVQSAISLVFYAFGSCMGVIRPSGSVTVQWGGIRVFNSYFGLYFSDNDSPYGILSCGRNTGIFTEAPMHAYMLVLALAVQLFVINELRLRSITIILVAIFTTYSTTGMAVSIMAIALRVLCSSLKWKKVLSVGIVLPGAIFATWRLYEQKLTFAETSVMIRGDNLQNAWDVFLHYPFAGIGLKAESFNGSTIGHTSVMTQVLADGGLVLFTFFYSTVLLVLVQSAMKRSWRVFSLYACYFVTGLFTVVTYTSLTILMVSLSYWVLKRLISPSQSFLYWSEHQAPILVHERTS